MANDTNYIGIAMGLDVSDLKSGLSEANKQIQLANSEFKAASSGMDNWQTSIDGVSAKVKQLDSVLKAQKSKLSGLQAEYDRVSKSQGENSEAAKKLKIQINNQQAVVNTTQKEFDKYSDTLKQAKDGNIDLTEVASKNSKALKEQGNSASESSSKMGGLKAAGKGLVGVLVAAAGAAAAAVGGFLGLAESTRETRTQLGQLEAAFTTAGHSAETARSTVEELTGILGDQQQATEAAQQLSQLAKSEKELADYTHILTGVYATWGESLKTEGLSESINHTIKLGEVNGNLSDALEWSGISVDDFNKQLATCNTEEERSALIVSTLNGLYGEAADKYKEVNKDVIEAQEAQAKLNNALADLGKIAEPIMTTLKLLAADMLNSITPFVELIGTGLQGAFEGTAGATQTLSEGIMSVINALLLKVQEMLPTILSVITNMLPLLATLGVQIIQSLVDVLIQNLPMITNSAIQIILSLVNGITKMLPALIPAVVSAILLIVETLIDNLDLIIDSGIKLIMALASGLIDALPKLIDKIPVIIDKLLAALSRNEPKLIESGIKLLVALASGLIKAIPQLASKIPEIISSIVKAFSDNKDNMEKVGLNLVKGIWSGIKGGADWLKNKITGFAGDVAGWFKDTFKIKSPSKLMADEVGLFIGEGIGEGVLDSLPYVKKQLSEFSSSVSDNLGNIKYGLGNTPMGSRGGQVINAGMTVNYNGTLSRKQLKQLENDNYNSIKMRLKTEGAI